MHEHKKEYYNVNLNSRRVTRNAQTAISVVERVNKRLENGEEGMGIITEGPLAVVDFFKNSNDGIPLEVYVKTGLHYSQLKGYTSQELPQKIAHLPRMMDDLDDSDNNQGIIDVSFKEKVERLVNGKDWQVIALLKAEPPIMSPNEARGYIVVDHGNNNEKLIESNNFDRSFKNQYTFNPSLMQIGDTIKTAYPDMIVGLNEFGASVQTPHLQVYRSKSEWVNFELLEVSDDCYLNLKEFNRIRIFCAHKHIKTSTGFYGNGRYVVFAHDPIGKGRDYLSEFDARSKGTFFNSSEYYPKPGTKGLNKEELSEYAFSKIIAPGYMEVTTKYITVSKNEVFARLFMDFDNQKKPDTIGEILLLMGKHFEIPEFQVRDPLHHSVLGRAILHVLKVYNSGPIEGKEAQRLLKIETEELVNEINAYDLKLGSSILQVFEEHEYKYLPEQDAQKLICNIIDSAMSSHPDTTQKDIDISKKYKRYYEKTSSPISKNDPEFIEFL